MISAIWVCVRRRAFRNSRSRRARSKVSVREAAYATISGVQDSRASAARSSKDPLRLRYLRLRVLVSVMGPSGRDYGTSTIVSASGTFGASPAISTASVLGETLDHVGPS